MLSVSGMNLSAHFSVAPRNMMTHLPLEHVKNSCPVEILQGAKDLIGLIKVGEIRGQRICIVTTNTSF